MENNLNKIKANKIEVSIAYAAVNQQWLKEISVMRGTNAQELLLKSEFLRDIDELNSINVNDLSIGVFSQRISLDYLLQEGDRLEIYRPLQADPKEVRRQLALLGKTMGKASGSMPQ